MTLDIDSSRRGMRYSIIEGSFATIFIALSTGAFLTGYALMLGAEEFVIGLIGAIPFISQTMQILGAYLLRKYKSPQKLSIIYSILNRWVWFILIFLPFLKIGNEIKILIFLTILFISSSAGSILANIWTTWIGEIVPRDIWGKYFGKRTSYNNMVNIVIFFVSAWLLDYLKQIDVKIGYLVITSICFASGVVTTFLFRYHPDVKFEFKDRTSLKDEILKPLKDKNFRRFILFFAHWNFSVGLAAPFMTYHMLKNLNVNFSTIAIFNMLTMTFNIIFSRWWGKLIDRFGAKNVLIFNASNIAYIPVLWLIATPDFLFPLFIDAILAGVAWSGFNLAAFNIPLSKAPKENRSAYVAVLSIFSGFGYLSASMLAGYIATLLKDFSIWIFGLKFINLHILFLLSFISRIIGTIILLKIPEFGEKPFFAMVDSISSTIFKVFTTLGGVISDSRDEERR
ncbi:MAG: MFS transporter [Candidatus Kryptonium sp.]|nr:MFS transporter [Candidatus Kryptonium sp.]MCX7761765.1 MFS transporter [Candidatus Kryptonium sp.]MDW8109762.1 MFS transporter [Candidatus Kryptonium sp.]